MKLAFQGGAAEVGASCVLLSIDGKNILFDCGIRMEAGKELPDMQGIQQQGGVDLILVSHAHLDHTGSLPIISREYPEAKIYMTHATKDLVKVLLYDSLKIMESREAEIPAFAPVHVENMLARIICFSPGFTFAPFNDEIRVTFHSAGHIAGAAGIYVTGVEGAFFYSGDLSITPQRTVTGAAIPALRPDAAVIESTYGDRLHSDREIEEKRLIDKVSEVIQQGGKMLIPSFALGRAQEVILILKSAIRKKQIKPFKIYVDGMVKDICRIYQQNPNYLKNMLAKKIFKGNEIFYDDDVIAVSGRQQREEIVNGSDPCCIIASSGMLSGGPSQWYAKMLSPSAENYIAITGYQDEEAPGRRLIELAGAKEEDRFLKIGTETFPVRCPVGKYALSAHADKSQIISFVQSLGAKHLFFVHGDKDTISALAKEVQSEYRGNVYEPLNGEEYKFDLKNPRKQIHKIIKYSMDSGRKPEKDDLKDMYDFLYAKGKKDAIYTAEDLSYVFSGIRDLSEDEVRELQQMLNESVFFVPDVRRPFMFRLAEQETVTGKMEKESYMEVNQMLALADEYFPEDSGLYKKGARFEQKIVILNFNFPQAATKRYDQKLKEFEEATGWKVEVNTECNLIEAENLVSRLLPEGIYVEGPFSFFRTDNTFKITVNKGFDTSPFIERFKSITAMEMIIEVKGTSSSQKTPVKRESGQMEQNKVFSLIDMTFSGKPDRIYKKGLKSDDKGSFIELSFISPLVGKRYEEQIKEVMKQTGWDIRINSAANQNEILKIGKRMLEENGMKVKKNLSYIPEKMSVRAEVLNRDEIRAEEIKEAFLAVTGLEIEIS